MIKEVISQFSRCCRWHIYIGDKNFIFSYLLLWIWLIYVRLVHLNVTTLRTNELTTQSDPKSHSNLISNQNKIIFAALWPSSLISIHPSSSNVPLVGTWEPKPAAFRQISGWIKPFILYIYIYILVSGSLGLILFSDRMNLIAEQIPSHSFYRLQTRQSRNDWDDWLGRLLTDSAATERQCFHAAVPCCTVCRSPLVGTIEKKHRTEGTACATRGSG